MTEAQSTAAIELHSIRHAYAKIIAVDDVSLTVTIRFDRGADRTGWRWQVHAYGPDRRCEANPEMETSPHLALI